MRVFRILLLCLWLGALGPAATSTEIRPVDEAGKDPSFQAFRTRLQEILQKRDAAALKPIIDPPITFTYGGGDPGWKGFSKLWRLEQSDSKLWPLMQRVLSLGGAFQQDGTFVAPYVTGRWPKDVDVYTNGAILGEHVNVRESPAAGSRVVANLSYEVVGVVRDPRPPEDWARIKLPDGRIGYVAAQYFWSPLDYRAYFSKESGQWRLTVFVAGD